VRSKPRNCNIKALRWPVSAPARTPWGSSPPEMAQYSQKQPNLLRQLSLAHRVADLATPPALAVAVLSNDQHLAVGAQLQLIAASLRLVIIESGGDHLLVGPLK